MSKKCDLREELFKSIEAKYQMASTVNTIETRLVVLNGKCYEGTEYERLERNILIQALCNHRDRLLKKLGL